MHSQARPGATKTNNVKALIIFSLSLCAAAGATIVSLRNAADQGASALERGDRAYQQGRENVFGDPAPTPVPQPRGVAQEEQPQALRPETAVSPRHAASREQQLAALKQEQDQQLATLKAKHDQEREVLKGEQNQQLAALRQKHDEQFAALKQKHDQELAEYGMDPQLVTLLLEDEHQFSTAQLQEEDQFVDAQIQQYKQLRACKQISVTSKVW